MPEPDVVHRGRKRIATARATGNGTGSGHGNRSLTHIRHTHRLLSDANENLPTLSFPGSLDSAATRTNAPLRSGAETRVVRRQPAADSVAVLGARAERQKSLTREDLWLTGVGPPEQDAIEDHHKCAICHFVKSHPVS